MFNACKCSNPVYTRLWTGRGPTNTLPGPRSDKRMQPEACKCSMRANVQMTCTRDCFGEGVSVEHPFLTGPGCASFGNSLLDRSHNTSAE
jgi:hypothetical protein